MARTKRPKPGQVTMTALIVAMMVDADLERLRGTVGASHAAR